MPHYRAVCTAEPRVTGITHRMNMPVLSPMITVRRYNIMSPLVFKHRYQRVSAEAVCGV